MHRMSRRSASLLGGRTFLLGVAKSISLTIQSINVIADFVNDPQIRARRYNFCTDPHRPCADFGQTVWGFEDALGNYRERKFEET